MMLDWISNRFGIEFKPDDIETSKITTEDGDWDDKLGYRPRNEYEDYY